MSMVNSYPEKMNLSFSGCGFLCIYHAGVAAAIKEYAPQLLQSKISGASAGSIVAAGLISGVCISEATNTILKIVTQARSRALGPLHPEFNLLGLVREEIVRTLPPDAYIKCDGRLQISLTRWHDKANIVVNEFNSNEDLIDAIICSCFIPMYCGYYPPKYRGTAYIDGGFTDNQPSYDEHTITVSPFSGESDICPPDWDSASFLGLSFSNSSIRFTTRNLFRLTACLMPPSTEDCSKMCLQGFEDALRFLMKIGLSPCIRCITVQMNIEKPTHTTSGHNHEHHLQMPVDDRRGLSPMNARCRKRSTSNLARKRYESEYDTCCESEHMYNAPVNEVFPSIMRRTFDEAFAAENSLFKYLLSFRMFRYARTALGVGKLPLDMLIMFTKNMMSWISMVAAPQWIIDRVNMLIKFIFSEIDNQRSRYSRFSCHPALFESKADSPPKIELSAEAMRELSVIRERDRRRKSVPTVANESVTVAKDWTWAPSEDTDSLENVIEYTHNHDAMYAFHYLDANNKIRSFELFNMAEPQRKHACHSSCSEHPVQRPVSMVIEEKDEEAGPNGSHEEVDSGLSGVDQQPAVTGRRDACCSPVRHFSPASSHSRASTRTRAQSKRHGSFSSNQSSSRRHHATLSRDSVPVSSDSELDVGERLFYPTRRERRASNEYDGEPEPSDTDLLS